MSKEDITALLAALPADKQPADGEALAKMLVKEKKLTAYQAQQIYAGKGKTLVLGNYVILDKIGAGGMGQVFKARHKRMNRLVAIKLLPPEVNKDEATIQRFHREVQAAAKLTHTNIVIAYDADEAPGGLHFLVMEYVEGRDLAQVANSTTSLPVDTVLNYILQAARGLAFAHSKGVVHRDIKPANLLLDAEGTVKILDMGLARIHDAAVQAAKDGLTKSGDVMGTVDYMAPEQAFDTHRADGRADIYSLGCTMYRLLTKANLYEAESLVQKLMAHQSKPIPSLRQQRPDVSAELEAAFQRMVAKSVEDRFQTMGEVIAALEPLLGASSSSTPVKKEPDSKIKAFFRGLTGGSTKPGNDAPTSALGERVAVVAPASTEPAQTIALSSPLQVTDPVSDRSIAAARTIVPERNQKKPAGPWWRNRNVMIASGAGGFLLVLLAIWVIIKDKDGKEIARLKVPEGGSSETKEVPELPQEKPPTIQQTLGDPADTTAVATVDNGSRWPFDPNDGQEYTWSKPENLGSGVNTAEDETLAGISQDGLKLYFLRGGQGYFAVRNNLTEAFRDAREFPQIQNVQGFSVSATGRAMVIASTTRAANIDKIWLSLRPDHLSPLGPFELAPPPVNGKDWMIHPVLSGDGATLLACTDRNDGQWADIWMFTRTKLEAPFTTSERLPAPVNTPDWDIPFLISNDRCFVITGSQREKTDGEPMAQKKPFVRTIRYFTRSNPTEPFGPGHPLSIHLGMLDTSDTNGGFKLGGDRRTLYFESGYRPDSAGGIDLWMSRRVPVAPGARPSSEAFPAVTNPAAAASPPSLAKAPFDAAQAKAHQEAWAKHLGEPVEITNSFGMKLAIIPPGEFLMGDKQSQHGQAPVTLTKPFRFGVHEVTRAQWKAVTGSNAPTPVSKLQFGDNLPVGTNWHEAVDFCQKLTAKERAAGRITNDQGYRLPTEAEWEFACRAGTVTHSYWGTADAKDYAWFMVNSNYDSGPSPYSRAVGQKKPNPWGLYDLSGNVGEWCEDWMVDQPITGGTDPQGTPTGTKRCNRGGSHGSADEKYISSWYRYGADPEVRIRTGLRVVLSRTSSAAPAQPVPFTSGASTAPTGPDPPPAVAPFNAAQAKAHQEAWAKHLGMKVETPNSVGMKMKLIPPGEFLMGSSDADIELALKMAEETKLDESGVKRIQEERPQHLVRITKAFRMAAHEVTVGQFAKFIEQSKYKTQAETFGGNSRTLKQEEVKPENLKMTWRTPGQAVTDDSPVTQVTWNDAVAFCNWLSSQEQLTPCYQRDGDSWALLPKANGYRLPTEAEWEYACRAGTTTQFWFGDDWKAHDQYDWTNKNAGGRPHSVGSLPANPFGLYDLHGNVWEWCQDWYDGTWYEKSPQNDPLGPSRLSDRVDRGGGWNGIPSNGRSSCRSHPTPFDRNYGRGFRCIRVLDARAKTANVTPQPAVTAAAGDVIDLLKEIELPRDVHSGGLLGDWTRDGQALLSPGANKSGRIVMRRRPPPEYELTAVVQRLTGNDGLMLGLVVDGRPCQLGIDTNSPRCSGISLVDGKRLPDNKTVVRSPQLIGNAPHTVHVVVGKRSIRVSIDDRDVIHWEGDPAELILPGQNFDPLNVWFAVAYNQFKIHKLELRPLISLPTPSPAASSSKLFMHDLPPSRNG